MIRDRYDYTAHQVWVVCGQSYNDMIHAGLAVETPEAYKSFFDAFVAKWASMQRQFDGMLAAADTMVETAGGYESLTEDQCDLLDRVNIAALPVSMYAPLDAWMFPIAPDDTDAAARVAKTRACRIDDMDVFINLYRSTAMSLRRQTDGIKRDKNHGRN